MRSVPNEAKGMTPALMELTIESAGASKPSKKQISTILQVILKRAQK